MTLAIDGREVAGGGTLLDVCRREGIEVPAYCAGHGVERGGHCRACLVEVGDRLEPACTTPARDGASVATASARVLDYRERLAELVAAEHARHPRVDSSHPLLRIDLASCILCRLCVAVCEQVQGQMVWTVEGRGAAARVTWGDGDFASSACVSCGACASVCPTGAIVDVDILAERRALDVGPVRRVRSVCPYCGVGCAIDVRVAGDDVVRIEGAPSPVSGGHLCVKGRYAHGYARHPDRLRTPLLRRGGTLEPASWDEALGYVVSQMKRLRGRLGGLSSSRCTNEENYLLQKWLRAGFGTNNVDCCARVCHAPTAAGMRRSFGTGAATNSFADIERADLFLVVGSNTTESHPVVGARVKRRVLSGAGLVVVDPRRTELAALADVHLRPRPGTNVALLNSLAFALIDEGSVRGDFVAARAEGYDELVHHLKGYAPETQEAVTGVRAADVRRAAELYGGAERPLQMHGLGVTEHLQGSESVMLLCNLAVLAGAVGREGVGVNPLRGQNNVQGAADMGCQPDSTTGYAPVTDRSAARVFEAEWGAALPPEPGLTLPRMYEAIDRGEIAGLFVLGEDVVQTDPDSDRLRARLAKLELLVVQEIFLSETAALADVVLPGASALEKDGTFTNGERRVQRVRKALEPIAGARADWEILAELMTRSGLAAPYASPRDVFDEIRRVWPALAAADYDALDGDGLQWPVTESAPEGTPILHVGEFARGKAALACVPFVASSALGEGPLRLVTGRVLEHYNSGSMTRRSRALGLLDHDALEIHPDDAAPRGIVSGDRVRVRSRFGEATAIADVTTGVAEGDVFLSFHFPATGTNRVTSDVLDRLSDCPEYKVTGVEVERADGDVAVARSARERE